MVEDAFPSYQHVQKEKISSPARSYHSPREVHKLGARATHRRVALRFGFHWRIVAGRVEDLGYQEQCFV